MTAPNPLDRIRHDVQGMHAYAVQDSRGMIKLDAMENPIASRRHCRPNWDSAWARWRSTAIRARVPNSSRRPCKRMHSRRPTGR